MNKINWCKRQENGLRLIEPNERLSQGYLKMSEDSIGTMNREKDKNLIFSMSTGYYAIYYSLYAVMQRIGVKCEIHSCSIEFVKLFLKEFYSQKDIDLIEIAFSLRNLLQYYIDKSVNKQDIERVSNQSYEFFVKSREIVFKLNEKQIGEIRELIK